MAAPTAESLLADAIKTGNFAPVYCLCGDNEFRKDEALRQIVNAALDASTRELNLETLNGSEVDADSLAATLSTLPMLAERRVVVIRDPGALKKRARAALQRYLEHPSPSTLLVLVVPAEESVEGAFADASVVVDLKPLGGERLRKWIERQAKSTFGTRIEPEASELLQRTVGNDLAELYGELDKLASYAEGRAIDVTDVSAVVGARPGETIVDLLDAVAHRDVNAALALVGPVMRQPRITGVTVAMALGAQILGIAWCRARRDAGESMGAIERAAFPLARRLPSFLANRGASETAALWARASADWTRENTNAALDALLATDVALKETRAESDEQVISTLVLTMCSGAERSTAVAA